MPFLFRSARSLCVVLAGTLLAVSCADAPTSPSSDRAAAGIPQVVAGIRPSIVLVHGAWSDGSAWQRVIPILQRDGYRVTAVQVSLRSLAADVDATRRAIEAEGGPVVLVGHSYGGVVITDAAAGNPNISGLVYIAAYAPEAGEAFGALAHRFGEGPIDGALRPDSIGLLYVDRSRFREILAPDLSSSEARVLAATQTPLNYTVFGSSPAQAAWRSVPAWFLISRHDRVIPLQLARFMARRSNARTAYTDAGHLSPLSRPRDVAALIAAAARAGQR